MKTEKQSCENCAHFECYYRWANSQFRKVYYGNCNKRTLTKKEKLNIPFIKNCEDWQPIDDNVIAERKENILTKLSRIERYLTELKILLDTDYLKP